MNITGIVYNRTIIFLVSVLITLFLFTSIHFSNNKRKEVLGFSLYSIISIIMFVDVMYYSYFNSLPSINMLKQLDQVGAVGDSVAELLSFKNILFLLDITSIATYLIERGTKEDKQYNRYIRWGVPGAIGIILVFTLTILNAKDLMVPISNQEIYSYHIKDIKQSIAGEEIAEGTGIFTQEDLKELKERSKLKEGKYTGIGKGKNLIAIQVEALQDFPLNRFYNGQEITPNLNKLINSKGSLYFDNYYQQIGRGNTADAEFVTNNSLYPSMEDPTYTQYEQNTFYGLPWILRDRGYTSWVFHGYEKEFWNRERAYKNQGFQRFLSEEDFDIVESIGFGITDEEFFKQSMDYLKELDNIDDNPFYAFLITLTSHTPFKMPDEYKYLNIEDKHQDTILGDYIQSIHYADKALGQFFEDLQKEGLYEDTVIAIYGDHFAITGLNDSGIELMTDFLEHPYDVDEMFKVPLIIHVPGTDINETISTIGSQLDFLPTILNIMGEENKKGIMFGRDLVNFSGYNYVAPQTYILKGSFIDDKVLFYMSRDSIFDNCKAKDKQTKEIIDVGPLRKKYENVIAEINKSDYILKKDLIKFLIANQGEIDINELEEPHIGNDKYIIANYIDPLKELNKNYNNGHRLLSVDLQWSWDREKILLKDEGYDKISSGAKNFKQLLRSYNNRQMDIEDLSKWMKKHKDAYIVLTTAGRSGSIFLKVKDEYPDLRDRFIVEMKDFEQYIKLSNKAFKNILLNLNNTKYTKDEIIDFLTRNNLFGVIIDKKLLTTSLPKELKKMGIRTYVEGERMATRM